MPNPRDYRQTPFWFPFRAVLNWSDLPGPNSWTQLLPKALSTGQAVGFPPSARWRESPSACRCGENSGWRCFRSTHFSDVTQEILFCHQALCQFFYRGPLLAVGLGQKDTRRSRALASPEAQLEQSPQPTCTGADKAAGDSHAVRFCLTRVSTLSAMLRWRAVSWHQWHLNHPLICRLRLLHSNELPRNPKARPSALGAAPRHSCCHGWQASATALPVVLVTVRLPTGSGKC